SLKYCVTSICSAGRRGRVVVVPPPAPGPRPPKALSPKKSEKNSSKRLLRPPKGERAPARLRPWSSRRCSSQTAIVRSSPFWLIRTVATAVRTPSISHIVVAISQDLLAAGFPTHEDWAAGPRLGCAGCY